MMARLKELEEENCRLKKMYAKERIKAEILQEAMTKKGGKPSQRRMMAKNAVKAEKSVFVLPVTYLLSVKPVITVCPGSAEKTGKLLTG